eukprot:6001075-Pleurochrysis_carterae.AAC.1
MSQRPHDSGSSSGFRQVQGELDAQTLLRQPCVRSMQKRTERHFQGASRSNEEAEACEKQRGHAQEAGASNLCPAAEGPLWRVFEQVVAKRWGHALVIFKKTTEGKNGSAADNWIEKKLGAQIAAEETVVHLGVVCGPSTVVHPGVICGPSTWASPARRTRIHVGRQDGAGPRDTRQRTSVGMSGGGQLRGERASRGTEKRVLCGGAAETERRLKRRSSD